MTLANEIHEGFRPLEIDSSIKDQAQTALERWLARRLSPTAIYNYPNIAALAYWLANPPLNSATPAASQAVDLAAVELDPQRLLQDVRQMTEQEMHAFVAAEMAKQEGK